MASAELTKASTDAQHPSKKQQVRAPSKQEATAYTIQAKISYFDTIQARSNSSNTTKARSNSSNTIRATPSKQEPSAPRLAVRDSCL